MSRSAWIVVLVLTLPAQARSPGAADFERGFQYQSGNGVAIDMEMAQRYYKRALDKDPDLFPALYNTALIYYDGERYPDARVHFVKAARSAQGSGRKPDEALARNGLGTCYQKTGKTGKAEREFAAAIQLAPSLVEAHFNLVNLLVAEERLEEAKRAKLRAEQWAPSDRYELFEGRMRGRESRATWQPVEIKIAVAIMIGGLFLYWIYVRIKRQ